MRFALTRAALRFQLFVGGRTDRLVETNMETSRSWIPCALAACTFTVLGCSSVKRPTAELAAASTAVAKADESQAASQAPLPLKNARDKLGSANQVVDDSHKSTDDRHTNARRLAEEALADADLADAQSRAAAARHSADELRITIDALRRAGPVPAQPDTGASPGIPAAAPLPSSTSTAPLASPADSPAIPGR